jgi:iron complex transport system ATP-binding protein
VATTRSEDDASDVVLGFSDVDFRRDGRTILDDITWQVRRGERWVVLGANGAGKTTLLRMAATYESPTSGDIDVLGDRVGTVDVRELRTRIGFISDALIRTLPSRTKVLDLVAMGAEAKLIRMAEVWSDELLAQARAMIAAVGCSHRERDVLDTLSVGEKQRVMIARGLMARPDLLLLDEPSAGLDVGGRELLVATLTAAARSAAVGAMVFVTHHMEEIPAGFTHALLLKDGAVFAQGALEDVVEAATLSECFSTPLAVERIRGRYFVLGASDDLPTVPVSGSPVSR